MPPPTRFERVTFAFGAGRLRANGQTDGWSAHLASDAGTACLRATHARADWWAVHWQCGCIEPCVAARPMQPRPPGIKPGTETLSS